jgi:1-acyl-sn-glycerol-3-phosphate acyltransferase
LSGSGGAEHSQFNLLRERRFLPFFLTQFFGAGNDNIFKFAFTVLATYEAAQWGGLDAKLAGPVIGGIFILPYVLFSATAGQVADKFEKSALIRLLKNLEIVIALAIAAGFLGEIVALLYAGVFLMGLHSTFFGPVKYAYLPQHLRPEELTGGNGLVETGTFIAILIGTMLGGALVAIPATGPGWVAASCVATALVGRTCAQFVPRSPAPDAGLRINWNPLSETWANLMHARQNRSVFLSLMGISWLWFFGSTFLTTFTAFARDTLGGDEGVVTLLLAVFSIGIGVGSLLCERMSGHKIEIGLVPFGSIGMTAFAIDLFFACRGLAPVGMQGLAVLLGSGVYWRIMLDLFLLAMFAGFYSVPLYALIQDRTPASHRARIIAANNILNALFMVAASGLVTALLHGGLSIPTVYLVVGIMNALVALFIYDLVPEFLMRFLAWLLIHTVYRVEKSGLDRIPGEGGAVIVANHVSFVDAVIIMGVVRRPVRFIMDHAIFRTPILNFIFRTGRCIPIAPAREDPKMMEEAFAEAARALREGDLIGIFPEGRITSTGEISPFRPGITRILEQAPVPVIPVALRGLWGSFFSRKYGAAMTRPFCRGPWSRVAMAVGVPVPASQATPEALQETVAQLRGEWK